MVTKKSSKADLESKRSLFFEIGLALAMLLVLMAFEWKTAKNTDFKDLSIRNDLIDYDEIPRTETKDIEKPAPPKAVHFSDIIKIVPNNVNLPSDIDPFVEIDPNGPGPDFIPFTSEPEVDEPVYIVEEMPKFGEGGLEEFRMDFVMKKLRYPEDAQANGVYGCVYLEFVVEKDGSLSGFKSIRNVDESLVNEAIRVVRMSPKWTPGKHNGKPARVKFVLPVNFVLN